MKMRVDISKIKPFGAILVLIFGILTIALCFVANLGVPENYESLHDAAYYSQNDDTRAELLDELREHVFPQLSGVVDSFVADGRVRVLIRAEDFDKTRAVLIRDFDEVLFEFLAVE